jgi:hypothetical protein
MVRFYSLIAACVAMTAFALPMLNQAALIVA